MCLVKTHRLPKISRKPIQVYKVFKPIGCSLLTPYQKYACNVGDTIKAENSWIKGIFKNEIEGEGVHAFIIGIVAFATANQYFDTYVYLCEIPPFTPYWQGDCDDIAASKMIIKEKVEL